MVAIPLTASDAVHVGMHSGGAGVRKGLVMAKADHGRRIASMFGDTTTNLTTSRAYLMKAQLSSDERDQLHPLARQLGLRFFGAQR